MRGADADLRLLAGDYLYALGLERLAALGDLEAVRELSDLISLSAQVHDGTREDARRQARGRGAVAGEHGRGRRRADGRTRAGKGQRCARKTRTRRPSSAPRPAPRRPRAGSGTALGEAADAIDFAADDLS